MTRLLSRALSFGIALRRRALAVVVPLGLQAGVLVAQVRDFLLDCREDVGLVARRRLRVARICWCVAVTFGRVLDDFGLDSLGCFGGIGLGARSRGGGLLGRLLAYVRLLVFGSH